MPVLETLAVGAVCAVAGATVAVIAMRHNLAADRAELASIGAAQDNRDLSQDNRYDELAAWSDDLAVETDRLAQWDAFYRAQFGTEPDTIGSTVEEEDVEVPVNRSRFAYQPEAVRLDSDAILYTEGIGEIFDDVLAEPVHGTNIGDERLPVLADARAAIFRRMAQTGQHAMVVTSAPAERPVLIGQPRVDASVLHAIWNRKPRPGGTDDDVMPVPTTPPTATRPLTPDAPPPPPVPSSPTQVGAAA